MGLEEGKAIAQLAREVKRIFADPSRAFRIATTETSRAIHGGALLNAKESSLKLKKEWLASSDACPLCMELDGVEKELDEPFITEGTGVYARVMTPPRHPYCFLYLDRGAYGMNDNSEFDSLNLFRWVVQRPLEVVALVYLILGVAGVAISWFWFCSFSEIPA